MRRVNGWVLVGVLLLCGRATAQDREDGTIRFQIARHLVNAKFDRFFPYRDGWRDVQKIAQKIEIDRGRGSKKTESIRWRIADGPALGGVATLWRYGAKDRPSYIPTVDVGDVQVLGVGGKARGAASVRLGARKGESKASQARRGVRSFLQRQGFDALLAGRDLSDNGIKCRTTGNTVLWKAGLKVGGDGRKHYALGGRIKLDGSRARVEVNVGSVRGWRVAGPRNGAGRRRYFPSGPAMPRYPAYGKRR